MRPSADLDPAVSQLLPFVVFASCKIEASLYGPVALAPGRVVSHEKLAGPATVAVSPKGAKVEITTGWFNRGCGCGCGCCSLLVATNTEANSMMGECSATEDPRHCRRKTEPDRNSSIRDPGFCDEDKDKIRIRLRDALYYILYLYIYAGCFFAKIIYDSKFAIYIDYKK